MNFASNSHQCDPDVYPDGCEPCVGPVIDPKDPKWCPEGSEGQSFQTACKLKKKDKATQWAKKFKKVQAKKFVKSNKSISRKKFFNIFHGN